MKLGQMELVEVNEAFAPQYLAVERELGLDRGKTNVPGGAIAIGHPLAATGTRVTIHLLHALRRGKQRFGLGSACIGGGQGAAVIVEAFPALRGVAMAILVSVVLRALPPYLILGLERLSENRLAW